MALPSANKADARSIPSGANAANYLTASELNELVSFIRAIALADGTAAMDMVDTAANTGRIVQIVHNGAGDAQSYAIDISNRADSGSSPAIGQGARSAIVVHQYSDRQAAVQIDNTRSQAALLIKNAANETYAAGEHGTGNFLEVWGYTDNAVYPGQTPLKMGALNSFLGFYSYDDSRPWTFYSTTSADSLRVTSGTLGGKALVITGQSGGDVALAITQAAAAVAVTVAQNAASVDGLTVTMGASATNAYALKGVGQNFGASVSTSTDGGTTLIATKNGTGGGNAVGIINKGTGYGLYVNDGSANVYTLDPDGMPQIGIGNTAAPAAAQSALRGKLWFTGGGAGVADTVKMCMKSAADSYSWVTIATG